MSNQTKAEVRFYLNVNSTDHNEVYPFLMEDKRLESRIKEHFSYDADIEDARASFELRDMADLLGIIAFYQNRKVRMSLCFEVRAPELKTVAFLGNTNPKPYGTFQFLETGTLTPAAAANKLMAIAAALGRNPT